MQKEILSSLLQAVKVNANLAWQQSIRITKYTIFISDFIDIDNLTFHRLLVSSLFSNLGMIGISSQIQTKKTFSAEEFNKYKMHPNLSKQILVPVHEFKDDIINVVLHHHENYDGSGYPDGLKAREIPFESRLIRIMEHFDDVSLNFSIPDKALEGGLKEIDAKAGIFFDPELVKNFKTFIDKFSEEIKKIISLKEDTHFSEMQDLILEKIVEIEEKITPPPPAPK
jgi:HD-GYP domain-containing protein (c-di-GMP phosphodiesterase class II)